MINTDKDPLLAEIIELDQQYYFNVFGQRTPLLFTSGSGSWLTASDGQRYLDLLGGIAVNVLGHGNPVLTQAIQEGATRLLHCSNLYYIEYQSRLAKLCCEAGGMDKAFFCNSGAEANEAAIKLVRAYHNKKGQPRPRILSAKQSFHGRTLATVTATGQPKYNELFAPLPSGFDYVNFNDIDDLKQKLTPDVGAILLECVQGESGVHPISQAYADAVAKLCKEEGILLVIDEVQSGMGRTGSFTSAQHYGIDADIITMAKGLGGGLPIGAMLAKDEVAAAFSPGDHGSTFGGNPLVCRAACAVFAEYERLDLIREAKRKGDLLKAMLEDMPGITAVRGLGLMVGFDIKNQSAVVLKNALRDYGILVGSVGDQTIRLLPPLTVEDEELEHFILTLKTVLEEI